MLYHIYSTYNSEELQNFTQKNKNYIIHEKAFLRRDWLFIFTKNET
jgi:hypothetical protein